MNNTKRPFRVVLLVTIDTAQIPHIPRHVGCTIRNCHGGEGGIRTRGSLSTTADFKSAALDHSATSPWRN